MAVHGTATDADPYVDANGGPGSHKCRNTFCAGATGGSRLAQRRGVHANIGNVWMDPNNVVALVVSVVVVAAVATMNRGRTRRC